MKKENQKILKNRLRVGDELFCFNGRDLTEKVTVIEVDRKEKTAKLSNRIIVSRYPNTKTGAFKVIQNTQYEYKVCRFNDELSKKYNLITARKRLGNQLSQLSVGLMNRTIDIEHASPSDLEMLLEIENSLTNIINKYK